MRQIMLNEQARDKGVIEFYSGDVPEGGVVEVEKY